MDLVRRTIVHRIPLPSGAGATGSIMVDDSIGYVANSLRNTISQVNVLSRKTVEVPVGVSPQGFAFARGRLFVLNGNLDATGEPVGPSWITVLNPATNRPAPGIDSIPLTVALNNLVNSSTGVKEYNVHFAGAILAALPTLVVYIVSGRYFVRGLMAGSVKG